MSNNICFLVFSRFENIKRRLLKMMVYPAGIEPATHSLEGCCSVQLSYGYIIKIIRSCKNVVIKI